MLKKLLTAVVLTTLGLSVLTAFAAPANADDEYPADNPTSCSMSTSSVRTGGSLVTRVEVRSNSTERPTGRVALTYSTSSDARSERQIGTKTVAYNGKAVRVTGPRATQPGRYLVSSKFTPRAGTNFRSCNGQDGVQVLDNDLDNDGDKDGDKDGNDNGTVPVASGGPGGTLPDTGGPHLLWLLLGLGLVAGGTGLVVAGRREPDALLA